jgi:hypothetical protein
MKKKQNALDQQNRGRFEDRVPLIYISVNFYTKKFDRVVDVNNRFRRY